MRALNGLVIPLLAYTFGIVRWTRIELDSVDRQVRKLLTTFRMHHPRSSVMRLYIPRKWGGAEVRSFLNVKNLHNHDICSFRDFFLKIDADMHKDVVTVDKSLIPLYLGKEN